MGKNNKKKKNSPVMVVLITLLALTVVTFLIVVCAFFAGISNNKQSETYIGSGAINAIATEKVSVKINMENCTMTVGTKVQVTATVYPDGSTSGILWSSSDDSVFTIDSKGNLEVIGTGIVALTANFGDAYDSIAIECVESDDKAVLNLPDYSMFTQNGGKNTMDKETTPAAETSAGSTTASNNGQETTGKPETTSATASSAATTASSATKPSISQTTTAVTVVTTAAPETSTASGNNTKETTSYQIETTPAYEGDKVLSTQVAEKLAGYGFKQYLNNTYVYEENESYLGEIIISSNMTHIYIKDRSTGLDNAINSVLTELLPDSHENVWNIYSGATTDQTITVDGRVVRVVVPSDGGHSQIVIYN
ncbi:MAG: hypothetical protein PUF12_13265 [Thermoflexaceae bacterium]|nr:hypothetical protein [Thermoflexaceae bacterium]